MKNDGLYVRVDSTVKSKAQEILEKSGYTMARALDICLQKLSNGDLSILEPSKENIAAEYPEGFFGLFGSDKDRSMRVAEDIPADDDLEVI